MTLNRRAALDVALLPEHARVHDEDQKSQSPPVAVVVDVLRMSTTVACALRSGASGVVACPDVPSARSTAAVRPGSLLCGERGGVRIEGFDLGNSPFEYSPGVVGGRTLVMSTTNGTRAVDAVRETHTVVLGSIVNAAAVAKRCLEFGRNTTIVCAGTHGVVSLDDVVGAGLIARAMLEQSSGLDVGDGARIAMGAVSGIEDHVSCLEVVERCSHAGTLCSLGFDRDIGLACMIDEVPLVPVYDRGAGMIIAGD